MKTSSFVKVVVCLLILFGKAQSQIKSECPQKEFENFSQLVGNWKVEWTNRIAPPDKYETTMATAKIERNAVGCVLIENFFGLVNGKPFKVLILLNFESAESMQRIWLDSEHGQFLQFKGGSDKDIVRFEWERDMGTRRMLLKNEYREVKKDSFVSETFLSTDSGQTWNMVQKAIYRRNPGQNDSR